MSRTSSPDRRSLSERNLRLQRVKRMPSSPVSPRESDKKIKFSQSEVQTLIEQEVCSAVKKNETMLQGLAETIKQLDLAVDYGSTMQTLEARINAVTQRAEAALAHMEKGSPPSLINEDVRLDSQDEEVEDMSPNQNSPKSMDKRCKLFEIMETTKKALNKLHDDKKVTAALSVSSLLEGGRSVSKKAGPKASSDGTIKTLTDAPVDLREEGPPTAGSPHSAPTSKNLARTDPEDGQEKENNFEASEMCEEPEAERAEKRPPSGVRNVQECASGDHMKPLHPPLPPTAFPTTLNVEAAAYNCPQKPVVRLALIRNPPSLSVLWYVEEKDPSAPPMYSYSVLMSMEKTKGSGVFSKWITVDEVEPIPLPICVMISKYRPGHKVCVAVVGKDTFGRYGPYSKVAAATLPD